MNSYTRKFSHLTNDSRVALLIDSRSNTDRDFHKAVTVTATGTAVEVRDSERRRLQKLYLERHPHLKQFVTAPTCALVRMRVNTYYIVTRFQNVMEWHVNQ